MKHRYFLELNFKGTNYHGWQFQPNALTVQEIIDQALTTILKNNISTTGAGRTDSGVHARCFTAHFDSEQNVIAVAEKEKILKSLNAILPYDIAITDIYEVIPAAHARFSAVKRTYEYTIISAKDPFAADLAWYLTCELDIRQMNRAAEVLSDYNDFTSFSKLHTDSKTNLCKIYEASWKADKSSLIFRITADRFLRNMVRAIVGTMILVGKGVINIQDFAEIIENHDRNAAGASAPAKGLVLVNIEYPVNIKLT